MKQVLVTNNNKKHLLLFFAGWGMDETPFLKICPKEMDFMVCYDYRSLELNIEMLKAYSDITVLAWSMGVWAASQIMKCNPTLPVSKRIAINGTIYPIDEAKGIAPVIFEGTLNGLNERHLQKFQRRMCGTSDDYKTFQAVAPQRSVEELKEELALIQKQCLSLPPCISMWQKAFIGKNDRIFLEENQTTAWINQAETIEYTDSAHYEQELFENIVMQIK